MTLKIGWLLNCIITNSHTIVFLNDFCYGGLVNAGPHWTIRNKRVIERLLHFRQQLSYRMQYLASQRDSRFSNADLKTIWDPSAVCKIRALDPPLWSQREIHFRAISILKFSGIFHCLLGNGSQCSSKLFLFASPNTDSASELCDVTFVTSGDRQAISPHPLINIGTVTVGAFRSIITTRLDLSDVHGAHFLKLKNPHTVQFSCLSLRTTTDCRG